MQYKTNLSNVLIEHKKLSDDTSNAAQLFEDRFHIVSDNAASCVISGSTIAYPHIEYTEENLDASAIRFFANDKGVVTSLVASCADGLGDDRDDSNRNEATRRAAKAICQAYCDNALQKNFLDIIDIADSNSFYKESVGEAALSAAKVMLTAEKTTCELINLGDTLSMVLDGNNLTVKHVLFPRVSYRGFGNWSPQSVAHYKLELTKNKPVSVAQFVTINDIHPGDLIIQVTDGIWAEFDFELMMTQTDDFEIWQESLLDTDSFTKALENELSRISNENGTLTYRIAKALANLNIRNTLSNRQTYLTVYDSIEPYMNIEDLSITLGEWLASIPNKAISKQCQDFILNSKHDGVLFNDNAPVYYVFKWLKEYCFGDCATINVLQVPDYKVELCRALIEHPDNAKKLLCDIRKCFMNVEQIQQCFLQLKHETMLLPNQTWQRLYADKQIELAKSIAETIFGMKSEPRFSFQMPRQINKLQKSLITLNHELAKAKEPRGHCDLGSSSV